MLKLINFHKLLSKRHFSTLNDVFLCQHLKDRTLLQVTGDSAGAFLQGLITNDVEHLLSGAPSMFSMFLNSVGRVKYDSIIYNFGLKNKYFVECDINAVEPLKNHLTLFKVRRKVDIISLESTLNIWSLIRENNFLNITEAPDHMEILEFFEKRKPHFLATVDPRLPSLGLRVIAPKTISLSTKLSKHLKIKVIEKDFYKFLRYKLGVGEGLQELPYEKCFPMEANGDYLHGISFHKGCYLGQELTARTYHTGVIRKRVMPLSFEEEINVNEQGIPIFAVPQSEKPIGKLQGVTETAGVGLLRINEALQAEELTVLNAKCKTHCPFWWPSKLPKERIIAK